MASGDKGKVMSVSEKKARIVELQKEIAREYLLEKIADRKTHPHKRSHALMLSAMEAEALVELLENLDGSGAAEDAEITVEG